MTHAGVPVAGGVFTVPLNFDPGLFSTAAPQYLGIEVRPAGTTAYTTLGPRQAIGAAPVALSVPGLLRVPVVTQDQTIASDATLTSGLSGLVWQSFTCTVEGTLRSVTLKLNNELSSSERSITATLFRGEGTGGTQVGSTVVSVPGSSSAPRLVTFTFSPGVTVAAGDKLTVRLSNDPFVNWYISETDVYAGGRSSTSGTRDFALSSSVEIAGTVPSISVPSGLTTGTLGVGGVATFDGPASFGADADFSGAVAIGGNTAVDGRLSVGPYQGGTAVSAVKNYSKQLTLGGAYDTPPNSGNSVKLLVADYDNDAGSNIYPIYVEDENNTVDFFVRKQGNASGGVTSGYLNGNLGLGESTPDARLHVSTGSLSSTGFQALFTNTSVANSNFNTTGMRVTNDGFFEITNNANLGPNAVLARLNGTGTWTSTSDRRMKSEIKTETPSTLLDAALRLRPVTYYFNAEKDQNRLPKHPHLGLIAQEVQEVLPGLVASGSEMLTLDYSSLGVVAIGAVQEQQKQIDRLEDENRTLRERLERLEAALREGAAKR